MTCPRCMSDDTTPVGNTHYICNDTNCIDEDGKRTQFKHVIDEYKSFPQNVIFKKRALNEFYKNPYLDIKLS